MTEHKPKSFWSRPEGVTGILFLIPLVAAMGLGLGAILPVIVSGGTVMIVAALLVLAAVIFMLLDSQARALVSYGYKSMMRWITSFFITIDPIAILKNYVADLKSNLRNMNKQIGKLRGEIHKLQESIHKNKKQIQSDLKAAKQARTDEDKAQMVLKSRKAGRLQDSNLRLDQLLQKMNLLHRVLTRMYENSEILIEDIKDQVEIKEQEQKAIHASNSAMKSAMSVISGDPDKRAMFDRAMEAITEDVSMKVGEIENFMDMSAKFMDSIDLQNGVFEEDGLKMLEQWEQESISLLLGDEKEQLILQSLDEDEPLDLNAPIKKPERAVNHTNQYDSFFDF